MGTAAQTPRVRESASQDLRHRLTAVGHLLGVPVVVADDATWEITDDELRVGLGFYAARGHGPEEAVALALGELWSRVRTVRLTPERARRADAIARLRPELSPLVTVVDRLLAAGELFTTMPAIRSPLGYAVLREVPAQLEEWPLHLQWLGALLRRGFVPGAEVIVDPRVARELLRLDQRDQRRTGPAGASSARQPSDSRTSSSGTEPRLDGAVLRRLMQPAPSRQALQRFERAFAALARPYLALHAEALAGKGLDARSASISEADDEGVEAIGSGPGTDSDSDATETSDTEADDTVAEATTDAARASDAREDAEGSDLFEAEQAAFVSTILATPLPTQGALIEALLDIPRTAEDSTERTDRALPSQGAGQQMTPVALAEYRDRAQRYAPAIEEMREVWQQVVARQVAPKPALSRRPYAEGEVLATESLAQAVAEVHAGVPEPRAFRRRLARPRRTNTVGSTDYVLLIDRSGSMQGAHAEHAADAALIMLEGLAGAARDLRNTEERTGIELALSIRTALIVFDADPHVLKPLAPALNDTARETLFAAVRSPGGATNDAAAFRAAADQLGIDGRSAAAIDPVRRNRIVIFLSDGGSNDPSMADREIARLRAAGVRVWGIGLGSADVLRRFAPTSRNLSESRDIPLTLRDIIEQEIERDMS